MSIAESDFYDLPYSSKAKAGTMKDIEDIFKKSSKLNEYLPYNCKLTYLPRRFLLTLIYEV